MSERVGDRGGSGERWMRGACSSKNQKDATRIFRLTFSSFWAQQPFVHRIVGSEAEHDNDITLVNIIKRASRAENHLSTPPGRIKSLGGGEYTIEPLRERVEVLLLGLNAAVEERRHLVLRREALIACGRTERHVRRELLQQHRVQRAREF